MKSAANAPVESIGQLWQSVWAHRLTTGRAEPDRFTFEAYREIRRFVPNSARQILEAGCGTGRFCHLFSRDLPECAVLGVDISQASIELARNNGGARPAPNVSFRTGSIFALPYPDHQFDCVFSEGVIALFDAASPRSDVAAVREMTRVTKPGGIVMVSVPNVRCYPHTWYKARLKRKGIAYEYGFEKSYSRRELFRLLAKGGLTNIQLSGFFPSYGFYRLSEKLRRFAGTARVIGRLVDHIGGRWLANHFGFQILAAGKKPNQGQS